jgi:predicted O-linked N-acetylglucosamine transferase (SPINDLY family)
MPVKELQSQTSQALAFFKRQEYEQAEALFIEILRQAPDYADALNLYGCLCDEMGALEKSVHLLQRATRANPAAYPYFYNLGNVLFKLDRLDEALASYHKALKLKPDYAQAYNNLGLALVRMAKLDEAKASFKKAIASLPNFADPYSNLALEMSKEGQTADAVHLLSTAAKLQPNAPKVWFSLGNALSAQQLPEDALHAFARAIEQEPENAMLYTNLGVQKMKLGLLSEAISDFRYASTLDLTDEFNHSNLIVASAYVADDIAATHDACQQWEQTHAAKQWGVRRFSPKEAVFDKRLRIGYVSADMRQHAAAYWFEPLLQAHSKEEVDVYCYHSSALADAVTSRLRKIAYQWLDCAELNDEALADQIASDQIDILVDLSGHTAGNRLPVFARRPAPVQVTWFGFPLSTGLREIQYRLTDSIIDPPTRNDAYYSESLWHFDRFYAAFRPDDATPDVATAPHQINGHITYGSFNNWAKVTATMLDLWADILLATPGSTLLLQAAGLEGKETSARVRAVFASKGVGSNRVILRGWTNLQDYLRLGNQVDVVLDTYPFNGGVTTCHALWMGLPVVSLSGNSAASRVGRSILSQVALEELVAATPEEYKEIAQKLALNSDALSAMRHGMRARVQASGLLDGKAIAERAEQAFRAMWKKWCLNEG